MEEQLQEYRAFLIRSEQKAQEDYDKTVLSLSGGALGISFAFIKDIVGNQPLVSQKFLLMAWITWSLSVTCILASFYFSQQALRKTIKQIDENKIYQQVPGRFYSWITAFLNAFGGFLFLIGVMLIIIFVYYNLR